MGIGQDGRIAKQTRVRPGSAAERKLRGARVAPLREVALGMGSLEQGTAPLELRVVLQPQVNAMDGSLVGAEALARWGGKNVDEANPAVFLPLAAKIGMLPRLGDRIRSEAFAVAAALRRAGVDLPKVSVNIAPAELRRPGLAADIVAEALANGLPLTAVELEITENGRLAGHAAAGLSRLAELRHDGVRLALDDFGTGYAGLSHLLIAPFDVVKIDREFIRKVAVDRAAMEIVSATVKLAHRLNMEVVAEGVETQEQLGILRHLGCNVAQGFLMGRPMGKDEFAEWAGIEDGALEKTHLL